MHTHSHTRCPLLPLDSAPQLLASCSLDNTVALFRADSGRLLRQLRVHQDGILAIRFLADDVLVVAGVSGKVHLLQL